MADVIMFFLAMAVPIALYLRYKKSNKMKQISEYIQSDEIAVFSTAGNKVTSNSILSKYFNQEFLQIYGVPNTVIAALLTSGYVLFWVFVCITFNLSFIWFFLGAFSVMAVGIFLTYRHFQSIFSDYFESSFPYALRLISRNMAVGQTIYSAVEAAAQNLHGIMKKEFQRISDQLKNGATFEQILDKGEKLYPYKGYFVFSSYLRVSIRKGSSLKDTLTSLADDLISSQVIKKKTRSLTSESRGAAKILAVLPAIMLAVLYMFSSENFLYLFNAYYGRIVMIYVVISVTAGFVIISKMIRGVEL